MLSKEIVDKCPSIYQNFYLNPILFEKILLITYAFIYFIGVFGHAMTIIVINYNTYMHTNANKYLLNLAICDLVILIFNLPLEMLEIHIHEWSLPIVFCSLKSICIELFSCSSILTIVAFTCERYFAIVHPIRFHKLNYFHRAQNVIIIIWFLSLLIGIPLGLSYKIETNLIVISPHSETFPFKLQHFNDTILSRNISCKSCIPKNNLLKVLSIIMIIKSICLFYFPMIIIGIIYLYIRKSLHYVNKYDKNSNPIASSSSSLSNYDIIEKKQTTTSTSYLNQDITEMKQKHTHIDSYSWLKNRARYQAQQVVINTLSKII